MSELLKDKRIIFKPGKQREFLEEVLQTFPVSDIATLCNKSERTIRDWRREEFRMDAESLEKICKAFDLEIPKNIQTVEKYAHTKRAGRKGAEATFQKYGRVPVDEKKRKKAWREWWEKKGKHDPRSVTKAKNFTRPKKSVELAEFVGIVLGDGGISDYQITITLHSQYDREYGKYVSSLIKRLFNVPVSTSERKGDAATDYIISRKALVDFCVNTLKLWKGHKIEQQVDIPQWIKQNKSYFRLCTRGLMDTDGGIVLHHYKSNGKVYCYKKLCFCSYSRPLLLSVESALNQLEIKTRRYKDHELWIDSKKDVRKYFKEVGSSNPKHLKRYLD